jgi:putative aldouronate transport system permease protein
MRIYKKEQFGERIFGFVNGLLLIFLTLLFLYPLWHVIMASFSEPLRLMSHTGPVLRPLGFSVRGYVSVLHNKNILTGYGNTIFYVSAGTAVNMVMTILGAYVLSRRKLRLKEPLKKLFVVTMYIGGGLIPGFLLIRYLGLYDSRLALILPGAIHTWNMMIMRTAFSQIPQSLEESATLDGASDLTILCRIILPVSTAIISVMILYYAVGHWNAWFGAVIFLRDRTKYPLQLFLREILLANTTMGGTTGENAIEGLFLLDEIIRYCSIVVSTVPILVIYPIVQRYFMTGVMLGSLKE